HIAPERDHIQGVPVRGLAENAEDLLLVLEIGVEASPGDAARVGDVGDPGTGVPATEEKFTRSVKDRLAGALRSPTEDLSRLSRVVTVRWCGAASGNIGRVHTSPCLKASLEGPFDAT